MLTINQSNLIDFIDRPYQSNIVRWTSHLRHISWAYFMSHKRCIVYSPSLHWSWITGYPVISLESMDRIVTELSMIIIILIISMTIIDNKLVNRLWWPDKAASIRQMSSAVIKDLPKLLSLDLATKRFEWVVCVNSLEGRERLADELNDADWAAIAWP